MKWITLIVTLVTLFLSFSIMADCQNPIILRGDIVTMTDRDSVFKGDILICGVMIEEVKQENETWSTTFNNNEARIIEVGYIFPGLINLHDHTAYNTLPLWHPPKRYENRYGWQRAGSYKTDVKDPYKLLTNNLYYNMTLDVAKYDEIKSIVGGVTATQGSPNRSGLNNWLVRNVDITNFGDDKIFSRTLAITDTRFDPESLKSKATAGNLDTWFIHLAEGVDAKSRDEFTVLKSLGLLEEWTTVIHGTALGRDEFKEMGQLGAELVWSPLSNLLLYGDTTRIDYAMEENVIVSLATDWSPSGSKNLLGELKVAWEINKQREDLPDYEPFDTYTLAQMVTVNPAKILKWQDKVGQLKAGMFADIMAFAKPVFSSKTPELNPTSNPYDALVRATVKDIQLVMVDGDPVYGDVPLMQNLKGDDKEMITVSGNIQKAIDITKADINKGNQTYADMVVGLTNALNFNPDHMFEHFAIVANNNWSRSEFDDWLAEEYNHIITMPIDPVFVIDDPGFFRRIAAVNHRNMSFDLQDRYYNHMDKTLVMVNHPSINAEYLDTIVGISSRAANNIEAYRAGADGTLNSLDDTLFQSIDALDMIKYVGPVTLNKIQVFAESWEYGHPTQTTNPVVNFLNQETTTFVLLDITIGLRSDAAANLIARRNGPDGIYGTSDDQSFVSLDDLKSVSRVGDKTIEQIAQYVSTI